MDLAGLTIGLAGFGYSDCMCVTCWHMHRLIGVSLCIHVHACIHMCVCVCVCVFGRCCRYAADQFKPYKPITVQ